MAREPEQEVPSSHAPEGLQLAFPAPAHAKQLKLSSGRGALWGAGRVKMEGAEWGRNGEKAEGDPI